MSRFLVSYALEADNTSFVSQQLQLASVRVRGVTDEAAQEQLFASKKQVISQFFKAADTQHRLSGRGHTHFRVQRDGIELQYINNNGQPVIYVVPEERERRLIPPPRPLLLAPLEEPEDDRGREPLQALVGLYYEFDSWREEYNPTPLSLDITIRGLNSGTTHTVQVPAGQELPTEIEILVYFADEPNESFEAAYRDAAQFSFSESHDQIRNDPRLPEEYRAYFADTESSYRYDALAPGVYPANGRLVRLPSIDGPRPVEATAGYGDTTYPSPIETYEFGVTSILSNFAGGISPAVSRPLARMADAAVDYFLELPFDPITTPGDDPLSDFTFYESGAFVSWEGYENFFTDGVLTRREYLYRFTTFSEPNVFFALIDAFPMLYTNGEDHWFNAAEFRVSNVWYQGFGPTTRERQEWVFVWDKDEGYSAAPNSELESVSDPSEAFREQEVIAGSHMSTFNTDQWPPYRPELKLLSPAAAEATKQDPYTLREFVNDDDITFGEVEILGFRDDLSYINAPPPSIYEQTYYLRSVPALNGEPVLNSVRLLSPNAPEQSYDEDL